MMKLFRYLKGAIIFAIIAPIMMLLEVTMDLMQPTLISKVIDVGLKNGDMAYVMMTSGKMIGVAILGVIGGIGCTYFSSIASVSYGTKLRQAVFDKVQTFSFKELDELKTSSLITRITNDVVQMQNMILMMLRVMVRAPLLCIGGVIMSIILSPRLSIVFLFSMPILLIFVLYIINKAFPLYSLVQTRIDRVNTVMRENLMGVRLIKAFVSQNREKERFSKANEDLMEVSMEAQKATILLWPFLTLVMNFSTIAVLWFGGRIVISGEMEIGKIVAFVNYLIQILFSLMMISMLIINISRAKASADRINEVLNLDCSIIESENPELAKNLNIEFKNVSFKYYESEEEPVLRGISFNVKQGETVGIIGATGAGKSTLISLILRLYDVTEGSVLVGGKDIRNLDKAFIRDNIGVVLQENTLFTGTIEENLRWGRKDASFEELRSAAVDAQADDFISARDMGYKGMIEQRGKNFSGGQKQRLSIARVLVKNPKIFIMDDSTSALDMATEAELQQALRRRMKNATMFIIAQRISSVMMADKIIVLDKGEISAMGNHNELVQNSSIYRAFVESQLGKEALCNVQ